MLAAWLLLRSARMMWLVLNASCFFLLCMYVCKYVCKCMYSEHLILYRRPKLSHLIECAQQGYPFLEVSSIWSFRFVEFLVDEAQQLNHRAGRRLGQVSMAGASRLTGRGRNSAT